MSDSVQTASGAETVAAYALAALYLILNLGYVWVHEHPVHLGVLAGNCGPVMVDEVRRSDHMMVSAMIRMREPAGHCRRPGNHGRARNEETMAGCSCGGKGHWEQRSDGTWWWWPCAG